MKPKTIEQYPTLYVPRGKYGIFIGKVIDSNTSGKATIINMDSKRLSDFLVRFHTTGNIVFVKQLSTLTRGSFSDKKYGKGFNSKHTYPAKETKCFDKWSRMLQRAYDHDYKNIHKTYTDVVVDNKWHDYQNFAQWYYSQQGSNKSGFDLDKDLLTIGNKVYSEKSCCLLPQEINKTLSDRNNIGFRYHKRDKVYECFYRGIYLGRSSEYTLDQLQVMYVNERNNHIKKLSRKYRGAISSTAYNALMKVEFNIVDNKVVRVL